MMMETIMSRSLRLMFSGGIALGVGLLAQPVLAQDASSDAATVQRVEITGSAIKRIVKEGALPVQVLTQEEIKKTGVTSVTDLIQNLPAMQGFTTTSMSINGGGGGGTSAALHALPSEYTLVLLDGQRFAGQNLESIPLDAVERVEILTDGASALYGSDAIAGVVNFVLKKNKTDGDVYITATDPQHPGGRGWNAGVSKGFGNLDTDGYNILATYSHDQQNALWASQRPFSAAGGRFNFGVGGQTYLFNQTTGNTSPANINLSAFPNGSTAANSSSYILQPYLAANGNCGSALAFVNGPQCRFNYAATVMDIPETTRDAGLLKGIYKFNENTSIWSTLMVSKVDVIGTFAPSAQPLGISPTQFPTLYNQYIAPFLAANNLTFSRGSLGFRTVSLGGRSDDFKTTTAHFSAGFNTSVAGWDINGALTVSHSTTADIANGGYSDFDKLNALVAAGSYDPIMNTGSASLQSALLNGSQFSKGTQDLKIVKLGAQHDLFELPGGTSIVSLGADFTNTRNQAQYSSLILSSSGFSTQPTSGNYPVGGSYGQVPADYSRNNEGVSAEWLIPITQKLEVNAAARYDRYGQTYSQYNFSQNVDPNTGLQDQIANADLGNSFSDGTYKLAFRFTPTDNSLIRGSYGTGFKAPGMSAIAGPLSYAGSTSGSYLCPFPGTSGCLPGSAQYDLLSGGNSAQGSGGLKPEKSTQWTLGFRIEPGLGLSVGADLWSVQIKNQVLGSIPEQVGFSNPQQYAALFINPYTDPGGQFSTIGYKEVPLNGGVANYKGIDWDISDKLKLPFGALASAFTGTYMLKENYTFLPGGEVLTSLGQYGPDQTVVFRVQARLAETLTTGKFSNSVIVNYKSGYQDANYAAGDGTVQVVNADGSHSATTSVVQRHVGSYATFDWQGRYDYSKAFSLTAGIRNLFDRNPPLSIQNAGGGNQEGYDGRYVDPLGRTFYLTGHYKF